MLRVGPFANAAAVVGLVLHTAAHLWARAAPHAYEWAMDVSVAGLRFQVKPVDSSLGHMLLGGVIEVVALWMSAAAFAALYNRLARPS